VLAVNRAGERNEEEKQKGGEGKDGKGEESRGEGMSPDVGNGSTGVWE